MTDRAVQSQSTSRERPPGTGTARRLPSTVTARTASADDSFTQITSATPPVRSTRAVMGTSAGSAGSPAAASARP